MATVKPVVVAVGADAVRVLLRRRRAEERARERRRRRRLAAAAVATFGVVLAGLRVVTARH